MKIEVATCFNDKENDLAFRAVGDVLEVADGRGNELIEKGFARKIEAEPPKTKKEAPEAAPEPESKPATKRGRKTSK